MAILCRLCGLAFNKPNESRRAAFAVKRLNMPERICDNCLSGQTSSFVEKMFPYCCPKCGGVRADLDLHEAEKLVICANCGYIDTYVNMAITQPPVMREEDGNTVLTVKAEAPASTESLAAASKKLISCEVCGSIFRDSIVPMSKSRHQSYRDRGLDIPESICTRCAAPYVRLELARKKGNQSSSHHRQDFITPSSENFARTYESDEELTGVKGWLQIFLIMEIGGFLLSVLIAINKPESDIPDVHIAFGFMALMLFVIRTVAYIKIIMHKRDALTWTMISLVGSAIYNSLYPSPHFGVGSLISLVYNSIWLAYFSFSRRVRLTLTKR